DTIGTLKLCWPLVLGPLLVLACFAGKDIPWPHFEESVSPGLFRHQLGWVWFGLSGLCTVVVCSLSVGLPFFQVLSVRRTWTELPGALAAGQSAIWNSFWFAAVSATAITAVGCLSEMAGSWRTSVSRSFSQPTSLRRAKSIGLSLF